MDITAVIPFASLITGRNQCTKYYQLYLLCRPVYAYFKVHLKACNNVDGWVVEHYHQPIMSILNRILDVVTTFDADIYNKGKKICIAVLLYNYVYSVICTHYCIYSITIICDRILEKLPLMHKDKYLEIHNSVIQWIISQEPTVLLTHNSPLLYSCT